TDLAGNQSSFARTITRGTSSGNNQPPVFTPVGPLTVMPGGHLEVPLRAVDPEGARVLFFIQSSQPLPTGVLRANGTLVFDPAPGEIGTYSFQLLASDGAKETVQSVTLNVVPDPVPTTRVSGVVQDVNGHPLAGVPVQLGTLQTTTGPDGSFQLAL